MMKMVTLVAVMAASLVAAALTPCGLALPSTAPAFLWSPHHDGISSSEMMEAVNYQTVSPKELAKLVLSEGGWSNFLCSRKKLQQSMDLAVVFVGSELQSSDISANKHADPALVDLLKVSFTRSNFSMAFPYVAPSEDESMETSLVSEFTETCGHDLGTGSVAFLESCSMESKNFQKLSDLQSIQNYIASRMGKRSNGQTDLIVVCHGGSTMKEVDHSHSESEVFSGLLSYVEESGAKYEVLYVSDPHRSIQYPSHRELERFLAEGTPGNNSGNSTTCDELCQIKSSLLEGLLVALVLLIILISGLCCMMGIDTPTRFEAPQES